MCGIASEWLWQHFQAPLLSEHLVQPSDQLEGKSLSFQPGNNMVKVRMWSLNNILTMSIITTMKRILIFFYNRLRSQRIKTTTWNRIRENLERKKEKSISHLVVPQTFLIKNHLASYFIIITVKVMIELLSILMLVSTKVFFIEMQKPQRDTHFPSKTSGARRPKRSRKS